MRMKALVKKIQRGLGFNKRLINITILHEGALYLIAEFLDPASLICFSSTSRQFRGICMPIMFRHYSVIGSYCNRPCPPPTYLFPLIRIFSYHDARDMEMIDSFFRTIPDLPSVHTVRVQDVRRGIPMQYLACCEDTPSLHSLEITETQLTHLDIPRVVTSKPALAFLSRFVYSINHWQLFLYAIHDRDRRARGHHLSIPSQGLRELLEPMRESLRSLEISSHHGLFSWMSSVHWPRLRELCLDGMYLDKGDLRAIRSLISNLPNLQVLGLKLARTVDAKKPILVRQSSTTSMALSCLKRFTIAFPSPVDGIFDLLPVKLRHLSLRDWPRYYFLQDPDDEDSPGELGLAMPILAASECLAILRRCHCPQLVSLEVVYRADSGEDALFGHIVTSFPLLTTIELHRYREYTDENVPMDHIAEMLAALDNISSLRLNLDLPTHQLHPYDRLPFFLTDAVEDDMMFRAERCAEIIGPGLVEVAFILRAYGENEWVVWRVKHAEDGTRCSTPKRLSLSHKRRTWERNP
ncbi:hypothetical protein OF83DRAFT_1087909 [Amylostereum chailletii]|nr:hypothetical protein OF83DRAFT_1087909 [Amylostereum chailletii]